MTQCEFACNDLKTVKVNYCHQHVLRCTVLIRGNEFQANSLLEFNSQFSLNEHLHKTDIFLELVPESFFCLFFSRQHRSLFAVKLFALSIDRQRFLIASDVHLFVFLFFTTNRNDEHHLIRHYAKR